MSNGAACCALEICCQSAAQKLKAFTEKVMAKTGESEEECGKYVNAVFDVMEDEDLGFAPATFQTVVDDIVRIVRKHKDG